MREPACDNLRFVSRRATDEVDIEVGVRWPLDRARIRAFTRFRPTNAITLRKATDLYA